MSFQLQLAQLPEQTSHTSIQAVLYIMVTAIFPPLLEARTSTNLPPDLMSVTTNKTCGRTGFGDWEIGGLGRKGKMREVKWIKAKRSFYFSLLTFHKT